MISRNLAVGTIADITGQLRTSYGIENNIDDVALEPGEQVEILNPEDQDGDLLVTGLESGNEQFIHCSNLTPVSNDEDDERPNEVALTFNYPSGEAVKVSVSGWEDPKTALAALQQAGSPEALSELAEGFIREILGDLNLGDVLAQGIQEGLF